MVLTGLAGWWWVTRPDPPPPPLRFHEPDEHVRVIPPGQSALYDWARQWPDLAPHHDTPTATASNF